jgi:hypothetical protein
MLHIMLQKSRSRQALGAWDLGVVWPNKGGGLAEFFPRPYCSMTMKLWPVRQIWALLLPVVVTMSLSISAFQVRHVPAAPLGISVHSMMVDAGRNLNQDCSKRADHGFADGKAVPCASVCVTPFVAIDISSSLTLISAGLVSSWSPDVYHSGRILAPDPHPPKPSTVS